MIKLHLSSDNQFYFTVHAKNGKVLVTSETYKRKESAWGGISALKKVIKGACVIDLTKQSKKK